MAFSKLNYMQALRDADFQENEVRYRIRLWFTFIYSQLVTCEDYRAFEEIKPTLPFIPDGCDPTVSVFLSIFQFIYPFIFISPL